MSADKNISAMTSRERLLAALRCQKVDHTPWSPFLAYWWEHQAVDIQAGGQIEFLRSIGADALLRGFLKPFCETPPVELTLREYSANGLRWTEHHTPLGCLRTGTRYSAEGNTTFVVDHPVKTAADYRVLRWLAANTRLEADFAPVQAQIEAVGEDGLCVPLLPSFGKSAFQTLLEHYVGTEQLVYHLQDIPEEVEETLLVMQAQNQRAAEICADSPAEAFISWEDSSTTNVSPALFSRYIASELNQWGGVLHQAGKLLIHHACGHLKALLPIMAQEAVDAVESISPPPTGNIEFWQAQAVLRQDQCVIGGIEPLHFLTLKDHAFDAYVLELLQNTRPRGFILANSDSCPPGVRVERFVRVGELLREHGQ